MLSEFHFIHHCAIFKEQYGGDKGIRTLDPLRARQVLSQLSYTPINKKIEELKTE